MTAFFDALTPICIFAIIFGTVVAFRYMKHRETLKMIEHGFPPEGVRAYAQDRQPPYPYAAVPTVAPGRSAPGRAQLLWGLVLTGGGLALSLALWPIGFAVSGSGNSARFPLGIGPWMIGGFIPLFVGLALVLAYVLARSDTPAPAMPVAPVRSVATHAWDVPASVARDVEVPASVPVPHEEREAPEGS